MNCGKTIGFYNGQAETCYKEAGHKGQCFKTFGLEMESLVKQALIASGLLVVNPTKIEDCVDKVDFWILYGNQYLPVQFTVSREAFFRKGKDALRRGIIIIYVSGEELLKWEHSTDSIKENVTKAIHNEVTKVIEKFVNIPNFHFAEPRQVLPVMN